MSDSRPYFDVNQPVWGGADTINRLIGGYDSPEAAQQDFERNAPGAKDYLTREYQRLTGDDFADPFAAAATARDAALSTAIGLGKSGLGPSLSVASGSTLGPRVVSALPPDILSAPGAQAGLPVTAPPGTLTRQNAQQTVFQQMLQNPQYQLPSSDSPDFNATQAKRASLFGVRDVFDLLTKSNPDVLKPIDETNPNLQVDAKGKPIAGDVLNGKLFNDPEFQRLYRTEPDKAHKIYAALYGRDLGQDISSQVEANQKRTGTRDEILKSIQKDLIFDPVTNKPMLRTYKRDPISQDSVPGPPRELSAVEQHAIEQSGGFHSVFGFEPPQQANLTFDEEQKLRAEVAALKQKNPNVPDSALVIQARKNLSQATPTSTGFGAGAANFGAGVLGFAQNVGRDIGNTGAGVINDLLTGNQVSSQIPLIPPVESVDRNLNAGSSSIFDWLNKFYHGHVVSPTGNVALR